MRIRQKEKNEDQSAKEKLNKPLANRRTTPNIFWLRAKIPNSILSKKLKVRGIKKQELVFLVLGVQFL